eukprot:c3526_g1_i2.p1 GENE.c3526_g1_i2~~c3526_g1_i2.p1  ORF type:complete len:390 (+),score=121.03 c3526_g1_i2:272-1441(+)
MEDSSNTEEERLGVCMEYTFIDEKNPANGDSSNRVQIWTLDGDETHTELLNVVISKKSITDLLVIICVDFAKPWLIEQSLERWTKLIERAVEHAWTELGDPQKKAAAQQQLLEYYQKIRLGDAAKSLPKVEGEDEDDKKNFTIPLDDGALVVNLGVPVFFVATRTDVLNSLDYTREYSLNPELHDLVQQTLRKAALKYGGAVIYTVAKQSRTQTRLIREYAAHRLLGTEFDHDPEDANRECIFIPSGWDDLSKISGLYSKDRKMAEVFTGAPRTSYIELPKPVETPSLTDFLSKERERLDNLPKSDKAMDDIRKQVQHMIYNNNTTTKPSEAAPVAKPDAVTKAAGAPGAKGQESAAASFFKNILEGNRNLAPGPPRDPMGRRTSTATK